MKLGNISTSSALLFLGFAAVFNQEYNVVMDFVKEDPIDEFVEVPGKGWALLTEKYQIQFVSPCGKHIHKIVIFDRHTDERIGEFKDIMPFVRLAADLLGMSVDEVVDIAKEVLASEKN